MSRKLSQEEFEEKFYKMYDGQLTIVGRYRTALIPIELECNRCHFRFERTPNKLDKGKSKCPVCNANGDTSLVSVGANDMWSTHPDVARYLSDPEEGYMYRFNTNTKLNFVCPQCKKMRLNIPRTHKHGYRCVYCSDGISYPNKLMANLLDELHIDFVPEFHFGKSLFRYDFYFVYNQTKYIVEMDGGYGHGNIETRELSVEEQIVRDYEKDAFAIQNNCIVVRIDCNYGKVENRKEYIRKNILDSLLSSIFVFTNEMFDKADANAKNSQCVLFASLWNNEIHSYDELMKKLHVTSRGAIRRYAAESIQLQLIAETYDEFLTEVRLASNKKIAKSKGQPVVCEQTNQMFASLSEVRREMGIASLSDYFLHNWTHCGELPDGTKLTWKKLTKEEYEYYKHYVQKGA